MSSTFNPEGKDVWRHITRPEQLRGIRLTDLDRILWGDDHKFSFDLRNQISESVNYLLKRRRESGGSHNGIEYIC